ncbi:MAG: bifunctional phosphoglucose/phosphomannose isomerase, partial [Actinomycetota bacterium]|nr:bifunctional phosphoglucose/phosphomannose isomerase [Actinomycetota bacterium]
MAELDRGAVAAVDSTDQAGDMLGLAEQLRDALWRVDSAGIAPGEAAGVGVAGMGGSAAGARL